MHLSPRSPVAALCRRRGTRFTLLMVAAVIPLSIAVPRAGATPQISGADTDVWSLANPVPTYELTTGAATGLITWAVDGAASSTDPSPLTVKLQDIGDGLHRLVATDGDPLAAERAFRVDLTPPSITIVRPMGGDQIDQGALVTAEYSCEGAVSCIGTAASGAALDTSQSGPGRFTVRATDDVGNESVSLVDYVVRSPGTSAGPVSSAPSEAISLVETPAAPAEDAGRGPRYRPRTLNARTLRPAAGLRIPTRTPLLRWGARKGAALYNVQIYWLRGTAVTKVVSLFPRGHNLRVPRGRVAFGHTYIWRVWPYVNGRYTSRPLGLSYFTVKRRPG